MKTNMELWIEDLRSGEYEQISGSLCGDTDNNTIGYCCLGVAERRRTRETDLHGGLPSPDLGEWLGIEVDPSVLDSETEWDPRIAIPRALTEAELIAVLGVTSLDNNQQHLLRAARDATRGITASKLNDTYKLSFTEIANLIEKYGIHEELGEPNE